MAKCKASTGSAVKGLTECNCEMRVCCTGNDVGICARFPGQLCAHVCVNTPDSYRCACREGFTLQSDGRTCQQNSSYTTISVPLLSFVSLVITSDNVFASVKYCEQDWAKSFQTDFYLNVTRKSVCRL